MIREQRSQCVDVSGDDRVDRGLEGRDTGSLIREGLHVRCELGPTREPMFARDEELRGCQSAVGVSFAILAPMVFHATGVTFLARDAFNPRMERGLIRGLARVL